MSHHASMHVWISDKNFNYIQISTKWNGMIVEQQMLQIESEFFELKS